MLDESNWIRINCIHEGNNEYSINKLTFKIRNEKSMKILEGGINRGGYRVMNLNGKKYLHHRIIAMMFIPNPEDLPEVDHINHDKLDNRISNLRWVSSYENSMNKTKWRDNIFETIDSLPDDAKPLIYRGVEYNDFYFSKTLDHVIIKRINDYQLINWTNKNEYKYAQLPIGRNKTKTVSHDVILREIYFSLPNDVIELVYNGQKYPHHYYSKSEDVIICKRDNDYIKYKWIDNHGFFKIHIIFNNKGVWISKDKLLKNL